MNPIDVAQQYFDAWNRRDPAAVLATMAEDGTYSDPGTGGPISGQAFAGYMQGLFAAFPDTSFSIASVGLAAPDLVAAQWIMRGTNSGSLMGMPPSGRSIAVTGISIERIASGKIAETWVNFDALGMMQQLGVIPAPGQAG